MIDRGREIDLEELSKAMKSARTQGEREYLERIMYRIINQSTTVTSLRTELINATRAKDLNRIRKIQLHLQYVRLEETRGASWGSNDLEREIK